MKSGKNYPAINVLNVMRGFRHPKLKHHITPYRFEMPDGSRHRITQIRQTTVQRVGDAHHHHYVICTDEDRYFHIVFDTGSLTWRFIQEIEEELFFNK